MSCKDIGGKNYVKNYTSVECDDEHQKYTVAMLLPILILWSLVFPVILMILLKRKQFELNKIKVRISLGFLFLEYSEKAY